MMQRDAWLFADPAKEDKQHSKRVSHDTGEEPKTIRRQLFRYAVENGKKIRHAQRKNAEIL